MSSVHAASAGARLLPWQRLAQAQPDMQCVSVCEHAHGPDANLETPNPRPAAPHPLPARPRDTDRAAPRAPEASRLPAPWLYASAQAGPRCASRAPPVRRASPRSQTASAPSASADASARPSGKNASAVIWGARPPCFAAVIYSDGLMLSSAFLTTPRVVT